MNRRASTTRLSKVNQTTVPGSSAKKPTKMTREAVSIHCMTSISLTSLSQLDITIDVERISQAGSAPSHSSSHTPVALHKVR
jgi:hypothetical protein